MISLDYKNHVRVLHSDFSLIFVLLHLVCNFCIVIWALTLHKKEHGEWNGTFSGAVCCFNLLQTFSVQYYINCSFCMKKIENLNKYPVNLKKILVHNCILDRLVLTPLRPFLNSLYNLHVSVIDGMSFPNCTICAKF